MTASNSEVMGPAKPVMVLEGRSNWSKWSTFTQEYLHGQGVDFTMLTDADGAQPTAGPAQKAWNLGNARVNSYILLNISDELYDKLSARLEEDRKERNLEMVDRSAAKKWSLLSEMMTTYSNSDKVNIYQRLLSLHDFDWSSGDHEAFIKEFSAIHSELRAAGAPIDEGVLCGLFLALLPGKYATFRTVQAGRAETKVGGKILTLNFLIKTFREEAKAQCHDGTSEHVRTLKRSSPKRRVPNAPEKKKKTASNSRPCPHHGGTQVNHSEHDCRLKGMKCNRCGQLGHKEKNCKSNQTQRKPSTDAGQHRRVAVMRSEAQVEELIAETEYEDENAVVVQNDSDRENQIVSDNQD